MTTVIKPKPIETEPSYGIVHYVARKVIDESCSHCGATRRIHAALRKDASPVNLRSANDGTIYSIAATDYFSLCIPCHRQYDQRTHCTHGHAFTPDNTGTKSDGARRCLTCHREQEKLRNSDIAGRRRKQAADKSYRSRHPLTPEQKARKLELQRQRRDAARSARFEHGEGR